MAKLFTKILKIAWLNHCCIVKYTYNLRNRGVDRKTNFSCCDTNLAKSVGVQIKQ